MKELILIAIGFWLCFRNRDKQSNAVLGSKDGPLGKISVQELEQDIARTRQYWSFIVQEASRHNLDPCLVAALIHKESQGKHNARNRLYYGLMQLSENTARRYGLRGVTQNLYNPRENIRVGTNYLAKLHDIYGGGWKAVSAYNAGSPTLKNQEYIRDVEQLRQLYCQVSIRGTYD